MLTLLLFQSYLISRWHKVFNFQFLWSKLTLPIITLSKLGESSQSESILPLKLDQNKNIAKIIVKNGLKTEGDQEHVFSDPGASKSQTLSVMSIEEKFRAAVKVIHSLPKDGPYQPSNGTKLKFYGLFKQATEGKCNISKPAFWDMIGKYKWDAWNKLSNMTKEEAMIGYVDGLKEIVETMSFNGDVQDFLDSIGPFYEFVNLQGAQMIHIKEEIERFTSSSSDSSVRSSLSNSLANSPVNSCPNSPLKNIQDSLVNNDNDSADSITSDPVQQIEENEKVNVQVGSRTASYETIVTKATVHNNTMSQSSSLHNGDATDFSSSSVFPPPTPIHTYSHRNSLAQQNNNSENEDDIQEEYEGDELMRVTPGSNSHKNFSSSKSANCKEDLENDPNSDGVINGQRFRNNKLPSHKMSVDTITTTSGTESEKYYSGDSEPDVDERFLNYFPHNNSSNSNPGTSRSVSQTDFAHHNGHDNQHPGAIVTRAHASTLHSLSSKGIPQNGFVGRRTKERSSPKMNAGCNHFATQGGSPTGFYPSGDLALQSTVDRLNRDVDHILARLRILETAYATSAESSTRVQNPRRRLLSGLSNSSIAFIVMWPFAVHFLVKLITWWWSKRRRQQLLRIRLQ